MSVDYVHVAMGLPPFIFIMVYVSLSSMEMPLGYGEFGFHPALMTLSFFQNYLEGDMGFIELVVFCLTKFPMLIFLIAVIAILIFSKRVIISTDTIIVTGMLGLSKKVFSLERVKVVYDDMCYQPKLSRFRLRNGVTLVLR